MASKFETPSKQTGGVREMGLSEQPLLNGDKELGDARKYGPTRAASVLTPTRNVKNFRWPTKRSM